jgi:DNA-binding NtrC family response regulator
MTYDIRSAPVLEAHETIEIAVAYRPIPLALEIQDDGRSRRIPLRDSPLVVGTSREADIVVRDRTVSSRHCSVLGRDGGLVVRDLGSRNGTYVGGARIEQAIGGAGTTILVGHTTLVCVAAAEDDETDLTPPLEGVAGGSTLMRRVASQVRRLAALSAPVLVAGETGSGKELVARALHLEGARANGPFVALNVAALPRELVETELFGHERGAFTGAVARRLGAFLEAAGGTLFLDEIGELPIDAQPKLLRALDGYEVRRVGGVGSGHRADARVIAATHVPLGEHVRSGRFRRDLFHRLEVFVIELPPLRKRRGDILPIAKALLERMEHEIGPRSLTPAALAQLMGYDWPGNVRELRNVLLRAASHANSDRFIEARAIVQALRIARSEPAMDLSPVTAHHWLASHRGNISAAARAAKIPRTSFRKLLGRVP